VTDLWPDAETGEMISDGTVLSFEAASAITKGDLVYLSADMTVSKCTAVTQYALGVALTTVSTGEVCSVCTCGVVKVTAGGAINSGEAVQTDADAQAITLAAGSATYDETELPDRIARKVGVALQTFSSGDTGLIHVSKT
jgi:predicted RecA/RadA family phage recombinase